MAFTYSVIAEVKRDGTKYVSREINTGEIVTDVPHATQWRAFKEGEYVGRVVSVKGNTYWRRVKKDEVPNQYTAASVPPNQYTASQSPKEKPMSVDLSPTSEDKIRETIKNCMSIKPDELEIDELNWKLCVRGALRGSNILLLGKSGCGKTYTAQSLALALNRPFFYFNMGAMQDARASLIGNTHYSPEKGTFFCGSEFVKAIQTDNAIILLDEESRISHDAENIALTVLDKNQRYLRIDEDTNTPTIHVADGVTFIATANIGSEFTSTRILDRATTDRWDTIVELQVLSKEQEVNLMKKKFPEMNPKYIDAFADVAEYTRANLKSSNPTLSTIVSTRSLHEQCRLAMDGFRFSEVMEALVYQIFTGEGGIDSERGEMKRVAQQKAHLDGESALISENKKSKEKEEDDVIPEPANTKNMFDVDRDAL